MQTSCSLRIQNRRSPRYERPCSSAVVFFTRSNKQTPTCHQVLDIAWSAPSHYLNQCRNIINLSLRNKLQCYFNRNSIIFIKKNLFENVACEMASILSRPQSVKPTDYEWTYSEILCYHSDRQKKLHSMVFHKCYMQVADRYISDIQIDIPLFTYTTLSG